MEDPEESEWKLIQEQYYSSFNSKELEDEEASLVKWMLTNGYVIGVTGIVLPPLFVCSAIGVAVSVPFGFLFASYACTNKLMSIWLPIPPPPSPLMQQLEYNYTTNDESTVDQCKLGLNVDQEDDQYAGYQINKDYKEDHIAEDIINQGVDIVLEFDGIGSDDYRQKGQTLMTDAGEDRIDENESNNTLEVNEDGKLRDNGKVDNTIEDDCVDNTTFGVVETTEPVTVKEMDLEKLVSENDEPVGEMRHVVVLSSGNEENNFNSREVEEIDLVAREVMGDAKKDERNIESDEDVLRESMGTRDINGDDASKDGSEDAILIKTMEEHLVDSLHERDTNINSESLEVGNNEVKENSADENVDVSARSYLKQAPLDTDNAKDAFITYKKLSSNKENLDDEKMWERIGAMRAIVGYKAPSQATCIGELKALYVFTGVEPPASFEGDSDLDEVNAKLKFLMAIVGVK